MTFRYLVQSVDQTVDEKYSGGWVLGRVEHAFRDGLEVAREDVRLIARIYVS